MFNPLEKYNGYSYKDVMIDPLAEALRDAIRITAAEGTLYYPPDKQRPVVYVSLQGKALRQGGRGGNVAEGRGRRNIARFLSIQPPAHRPALA